MNERERSGFRMEAKSQHREITLRIEELRQLTCTIPLENAIGRVSRIDAITNVCVNEAALLELETKQIRILPTLEQMHRSGFGNCSTCGTSIQLHRLMLLPESTPCVQCAN